MERVISFFKKEALLCISAVCALFSMFAVKPSIKYIDYIDFKVLLLLFCLMTVVVGFQECNLFEYFAKRLLSNCKRLSKLILLLVLLPFFVSMFVTNDVALITFVPFTIYILKSVNQERKTALVIVLQTIAANLGSMATQIGNPQNLYLYYYYEVSLKEFLLTVLPIVIVSFIFLCLVTLIIKPEKINFSFKAQAEITNNKLLMVYSFLFLLCIMTIFNVLDYRVLTFSVLISTLFFSYKLLFKVDYSLLITFVCFFIFSGNLGNINVINNFLSSLLNKYTFITSLISSQVISNVPTAVLMSGFTNNWRELLLGVDIGGLGTPVASLASLISIKYYFREKSAEKLKFFGLFSILNIIGIILLTPIAFFMISKY